jgi:dUTPase
MTVPTSTPTPAPVAVDPLAAHSATLDVQLLSSRGRLPTAGSAYAAGLDVYAAERKTVPARGRAVVDLQISVAVPLGHYARVAPRSGLGECGEPASASEPRRDGERRRYGDTERDGESSRLTGPASKHGIQTGAGVIDADYRGPVMVLLFNHSDTDFEGECKCADVKMMRERAGGRGCIAMMGLRGARDCSDRDPDR